MEIEEVRKIRYCDSCKAETQKDLLFKCDICGIDLCDACHSCEHIDVLIEITGNVYPLLVSICNKCRNSIAGKDWGMILMGIQKRMEPSVK